MTSSSKKKKRRRADFQKVKLKVGRKVPKGRNITNTTFQAKKIQIREQLRPEPVEPLLKIKQNLSDILSNLAHHNLASRMEATNKLKDLVATRPEVVFTKFGDVINRVGMLLEDRVKGVRHAALGVLKLLLTNISGEKVLPMFPILSAHLSCAMTHLDPEVQSDSLQLLDVMLDSFPGLLISSQNQILTNFLEQISHQRSTGAHQSSAASPRTLSINPNNKFSTQPWRLAVLLRLQKFLKAMYEHLPTSKCVLPSKNLYCHVWNGKSLYVMPKSEYQNEQEMDFLSTPTNSVDILQDYDRFKSFIFSLMPLLFETWVESCPSQFIPNLPGNCLPPESAQCLCCLMEIISYTQKLITTVSIPDGRNPLAKWFQDSYQKEFVRRIMTHFPYTPHERGKVKGQKFKSEIPLQILCCNVNLAVCKVFTQLVPTVTPAKEELWCVIVHFLTTMLENEDPKPATFDMKTAVEILTIFLCDGRVKNVEEKLLASVKICYQRLPPGSSHKKLLVGLFADLVLEVHDNPMIISSKTLTEWVMSLPEDLSNLTEVPSEFVAVMQRVACRNNEAFLHSLQLRSTELIDRLPKFSIIGLEPAMAQRAIIELMLWFKNLSMNDYKKLAMYVQDSSLPESNRYYCIQILNARYLREPMNLWKSEAAYYISFLMTTITGFLHSDLEQLAREEAPNKFSGTSYSIVGVVDLEKWLSHSKIMREVKSSLQQFENLNQVKAVVCEYLQQLLKSFSTLPPMLVWSVLDVLTSLAPMAEFILFDLANQLSDVAISLLAAEYRSRKRFSENALKALEIDGMLFERILALCSFVTEKLDFEEAECFCAILTKILQHQPLTQRHLPLVEEAVQHIEENFGPTVESVSSWASVQYELTLQRNAIKLESKKPVFYHAQNS